MVICKIFSGNTLIMAGIACGTGCLADGSWFYLFHAV
jgi:hypothetical protein